MSLIKPNIRLLPKARLHFSLNGWRYLDPEGQQWLLRFNAPWSLNWALRINENSVPILSRAGTVHLAYRADGVVKKSPAAKRKTVRPFLLVGLIVLIGVVIFTRVPLQQKVSSPVVLEPTKVEVCDEYLRSADAWAQTWLNGIPISELQIDVESEVKFGGIRLLKLQVSCEAKKAIFQLRLTKKLDSWSVSKTVRLEH